MSKTQSDIYHDAMLEMYLTLVFIKQWSLLMFFLDNDSNGTYRAINQ